MPPETAGAAVELLVALKAVAPFSSLPPEDLALLVERATPRTFAPGDVVIARGATVEAIHVLVEGALVEERAGHAWARREPYEIVGGVDALAGSSADVEVRAERATRTLELGRETLLDVCYDRFDILCAVATGVAAMAIAARGRLGATAGFPAPGAGIGDGGERGLDLAERTVILRAVPVLHEVPVLTLAEIAARATPMAVDAGTSLWRTGDRADDLLLLVAGVLEGAIGDGTRFALGAGEAAGVLDALAGATRWYEARARTRLVALRIRMADVLDVLEDDPDTAVAGLTRLARATAALLTAVPLSRNGIPHS